MTHSIKPLSLCLYVLLSVSIQAGNGQPVIENPVITAAARAADIVDFNAISDGRKVYVNWSSASERQHDYYTIEKSKDGYRFETAAIIKSTEAVDMVDYVDIDYTPYTGISYYRLKQTDRSTGTAYSEIITVNYQFSNDGTIVSCRDFDPIDMAQVEKQEILVVLRDSKGAEFVTKIMLTENGSNGSLAATDVKNKVNKGSYVVLASSYNRLFSQNLVIR